MENPEEKHFLIPEASIGVKCSGKKGWTENIKVALKESLPNAIFEEKHRKNCECCHHHSLFKGHNVTVNIVVLNCQK